MKISRIPINKISEGKFKAFVMFSREPIITFFTKELEYYSNENITLLGTIVLDFTDSDFNCVILARDATGKFRGIDVATSFSSLEKARDWIFQKMRWHTGKRMKIFEQGDEINKGVDLFTPIVVSNKMHPYFKRLNEDIQFQPAKKILIEASRYFEDIDNNFVEQFQSKGFDARLWELYLFCFFTEQNFRIKRKNASPDFIVEKLMEEIAVEAVIADRKPENPPSYYSSRKVKLPEHIRNENNNDMPLRFGSPLFSKLQKEYWKLPHVTGKPFILAIADFHDDFSMTWSFNAIVDYLYGLKFNYYHDSKGQLIISPEKIGAYTKKSGSKVESGFFSQPNSEYISAVLFSSTATISKFSRMGIQAGFGAPNHRIIRIGTKYRHDPNASMAEEFMYEVSENCKETWGEGVNLYHNPNALIPVDLELFPSVAHHELRDNLIHSMVPDFHPYFSINENIIIDKRKVRVQ